MELKSGYIWWTDKNDEVRGTLRTVIKKENKEGWFGLIDTEAGPMKFNISSQPQKNLFDQYIGYFIVLGPFDEQLRGMKVKEHRAKGAMPEFLQKAIEKDNLDGVLNNNMQAQTKGQEQSKVVIDPLVADYVDDLIKEVSQRITVLNGEISSLEGELYCLKQLRESYKR